MKRQFGHILVSTIVTVGFFVSLGLFVYLRMEPPSKIDPTIDTLLNIMVGALGSNFTSVVQYWIGSSVGSKNKEEIIKERLENGSQ